MSFGALDNFIVSKLESAMAKSVISPYEVARFCLVGAVLCGITSFSLFLTKSDIFGCFVWLIQSIMTALLYPETKVAERENNSGKINSYKYKWAIGRKLFIMFNIINFACGFHSWTDITTSAFFLLTLIFFYFQCLNWTPPPRKESKFWMKFKHA